MTYVLLNQVNTPLGIVAPGTTYADDSEQIPALILSGGIFGEVSIVGAAATLRAEKMKRRGAPWEEIELFLLDEAGKRIAIACTHPHSVTCRRPILPPHPPVIVPCSTINPWGHAIPTTHRILMRGSRHPSGIMLWAGDMITGDLCDFAYREGLEVVNPSATPTPTIALAFYAEVTAAKQRGDRTWEENEQAATRARFSHCVERCYHRSATCPPLYNPLVPCAGGCYPYLGPPPVSPF